MTEKGTCHFSGEKWHVPFFSYTGVMLFERFEVDGLSHYSYAVGCEGTGEMVVVDPERNIDRYVRFARDRGMAITHVLETHIHADYASGAPALAATTGATVCVSGYDAGETFEVQFPHRDLWDGDAIDVGRVRIVARHTPGHTPEHLAFLVYDGARSTDTPMLMLSGDFLFVGSLGRPDLLGEDAKLALAHKLYASVRDVLGPLPDGLELHPAHGAGSMCGAGMSGRPTSTLGFERVANPYLDPQLSEARFVETILATVPPFPPYYRRMKQVNSDGAPPVGDAPGVTPIDPARFRSLTEADHIVIDLRGQIAFGGGHVPGAFGIGLAGKLATWASWVVPYDTPILLVSDHPNEAAIAGRTLIRVGLDQIVGHLDGGMEAWRVAGNPLQETHLLRAEEVHRLIAEGGDVRVLDVRTDAEWEAGHAPGATHVMAGWLADRLDEVPDGAGPIAVVCGGGYRSVVAASVLERAGFSDVADVIGGMAAWHRAGLATVREPGVTEAGRDEAPLPASPARGT